MLQSLFECPSSITIIFSFLGKKQKKSKHRFVSSSFLKGRKMSDVADVWVHRMLLISYPHLWISEQTIWFLLIFFHIYKEPLWSQNRSVYCISFSFETDPFFYRSFSIFPFHSFYSFLWVASISVFCGSLFFCVNSIFFSQEWRKTDGSKTSAESLFLHFYIMHNFFLRCMTNKQGTAS